MAHAERAQLVGRRRVRRCRPHGGLAPQAVTAREGTNLRNGGCVRVGRVAERVGTRRPGGRSARVREAVLDATNELLADVGYEALRVEEVAARAGVHKT